MKVLVCGAGGAIGGHLVKELLEDDHEVWATDIKQIRDWWQRHPGAHNLSSVDLRLRPQVHDFFHELRFDVIYNLAADMGGIRFITENKIDCMRSALISFNLLEYAHLTGVSRYFFASSACIYPAHRQTETEPLPLTEDSAYPAACEDGYGWEKLFSEMLCEQYYEEHGLEVRVARLHNCYGPLGAFEGGREKSPAAICRKVAEAVISGVHEIEIWGDGEQTRSYMYVADAVHGIRMIAGAGSSLPVNLGTEEMVTINRLVDIVETVAGVTLRRKYDLSAPQGVRGRNSENTRLRNVYQWEPPTPLLTGIEQTYAWIYDQLTKRA